MKIQEAIICGHKIVTEGVLVKQLANNVRISV
jgi:hypothetical protein